MGALIPLHVVSWGLTEEPGPHASCPRDSEDSLESMSGAVQVRVPWVGRLDTAPTSGVKGGSLVDNISKGSLHLSDKVVNV